MTWIQTLTGNAYDFDALLRGHRQPIDLHEVAWCLSCKPRYGGHTNPRISVAEHSVAVCRRAIEIADLERRTDRTRIARAALMHDGPETYTGDVSRPLKQLLRAHTRILDEIEQLAEHDFACRFDISWSPDVHRIVKQADNEACAWEKRYIMGPGPREYAWKWLPPLPTNDRALEVIGLPPPRAYELFMDECKRWGIE